MWGWTGRAFCRPARRPESDTLSRLQVEKHDGNGPVKVTLDLSGESAGSDGPDADQPELSTDADDAAKFLQDLGFGGVVGDMPGYAVVGGPGEDAGTFGAPAVSHSNCSVVGGIICSGS